METTLELLRTIEKCPALYIGCKDIHRLRAYLSGYGHAACTHDNWLWNGFREWLADRYSDTRTFDWSTLIAEHEPDGHSTDAFFRLLNEYLATYPVSDRPVFRPMRRTGQQLSREECFDILRTATSGVLALHGDEGYPYAVPMSYVVEGESIFFHGAVTGHKIEAIHRCDKASFCVIAQDDVVEETYSTDYRSVIVFGRIRLIEADEEKIKAVTSLALRYAPDNAQSHLEAEIADSIGHMMMAELVIEHISGKQSLRMSKENKPE